MCYNHWEVKKHMIAVNFKEKIIEFEDLKAAITYLWNDERLSTRKIRDVLEKSKSLK